MKKKLAKLCTLFLLLACMLSQGVQAAETRTLRVGLYYGSDCVVVGNLSNVTGTGYRLGYYDDDRQFISLGRTQEKNISVMITQNLYLTSGGVYVYESEGAIGAVGCYHVQLPWTYSDYDTAQADAAKLDGGFVAWIAGTYYVRCGSYTGLAAAQEAAAAIGIEGATVGETSAYGYNAVATGTTRILFQYDGARAGELYAFGVAPGLSGEEKTITKLKGYQYYGGFRFERIGGGESTVVNMVNINDYVKGVIPYEMSPSWPLEALKAQAVGARTYAIYHTNAGRHSKAHHFDICTSTDCQVYRGVSGANEVTNRAVDETAGQMIFYNGRVIEAVYSSSHGGGSEDAKNVWGHENAYLKGVIDPYEADAAASMNQSQLAYYQWTKVYTATALKERLHERGYQQCGDIVAFETKISPTGNVIEVKFTDANGKSYTFSRGDNIRFLLGVNSIHFTVTSSAGESGGAGYVIAGESRNVPELSNLYAISGDGKVSQLSQGSYVITASGVRALEPVTAEAATTSGETVYTLSGKGWGHNVGMSQWGAWAMAKRGYTYLDILNFYYTGITVE